jgi:hypothetical protein
VASQASILLQTQPGVMGNEIRTVEPDKPENLQQALLASVS